MKGVVFCAESGVPLKGAAIKIVNVTDGTPKPIEHDILTGMIFLRCCEDVLNVLKFSGWRRILATSDTRRL